MALISKLLGGDLKLEAAATSDLAYIVSGARGEHVRKIQLALIALDAAPIEADEVYGPKTASAVLAYKRKRRIINQSYQSEADNIIGKMTITSLDREMFDEEQRRSNDPDRYYICGNGDPANAAFAKRYRQQFAETGLGRRQVVRPLVGSRPDIKATRSRLGSIGSSPFSRFQLLSGDQRALATRVFGNSLDPTLVLLTDFIGAENRAFTVAFGPVPSSMPAPSPLLKEFSSTN